jgi:Flp pilus assembly pilin Flp
MNSIKRFFADETGMTATEYAIMLALVAIAIFGVATLMWEQISLIFSEWGVWFSSMNASVSP